jgi:bifunctional non-homologous end joining protein LigD
LPAPRPRFPAAVLDELLESFQISFHQNDDHKTTVCVYSLRAKEPPTVSTPLAWDELESARRARKPARLQFEPEAVLQRVQSMGDLFAPVLELKQKLPRWGEK